MEDANREANGEIPMALSGASLSTSVASLVERIRVAESQLRDAAERTTPDLRGAVDETIKTAEPLLTPTLLAAVDRAVRGGFREADRPAYDVLAKDWFDWAGRYLVRLGEFRQSASEAAEQFVTAGV
jgi:hypothetical protein